jgi:hypothetical protein
MRRSAALTLCCLFCIAANEEGGDWVGEQPYRVSVDLPPEQPVAAEAPVGFTFDPTAILQALPKSARILPNSIRVVLPNGTELPHRLTGDWDGVDSGAVWWRTPDATARRFRIYFDLADGRRQWLPPARVELVGVGDAFTFNDGEPAWTAPGDVDWDADGLPDRVVVRTRVFELGAAMDDKLGYGVFFSKNLGTTEHHLFGRAVRLRSPGGEYLLDRGYLYYNAEPFDWDVDGDPDLVGFRGNDLYVMANTGRRDAAAGVFLLEQPRLVQSLTDVSPFRADLAAQPTRPTFYVSRTQFVDWEGDGDQDLVVVYGSSVISRTVDPKRGVVPYGSFLACFELFEHLGREPGGRVRFAPPRVIRDRRGVPLNNAQGSGTFLDHDGDGDLDLYFTDDAGRSRGAVLMWAENSGSRAQPVFQPPRVAPPSRNRGRTYASAKQFHPELSGYSVNTVDWDGDGVQDLVCTDYCGHILFYRNTGSATRPAFAQGKPLEADGAPVHVPNYLDPQADPPAHWGPQGPAELTCPAMAATVRDWDADGDPDLFVTAQNWSITYHENVGGPGRPALTRGRLVTCDGDPYEFAWRSRVGVGDLDADGRCEMVVTADRDNVFYRYEPLPDQPDPAVLAVRRVAALAAESGEPLHGAETDANNNGDNHCLLTDWDADGDSDLFNAGLYGVRYHENTGTAREPRFRARGFVRAGGRPLHASNHAAACDAADWNGDGRLDLIVGAEGAAQLLLFDRSLLDGEGDVLRARLVKVEMRHAK